MPRVRTNPETQPAISTDRVMSFGVVIAYADGVHDADNTYFQYVVNNVDENGNAARSISERISWADLPRAVKDRLMFVHTAVMTDAQNKGHVGAGTDSGDPA